MQIFPLTDVPFPILTYGRGVLILFFILYIFVGLVNYLYLGVVSRSGETGLIIFNKKGTRKNWNIYLLTIVGI